jgi:lipocalin-like protein
VTLWESILGAWQLVSFTTTDADTGRVEHPLGISPRGLILYTDDGHMSAQLADADMGGYVAYGGRFSVDEGASSGRAKRREIVGVVHHDVTIAMMPELLAQPQFRHASVDGDLLTLSATMGDDAGPATHATVVWRRG